MSLKIIWICIDFIGLCIEVSKMFNVEIKKNIFKYINNYGYVQKLPHSNGSEFREDQIPEVKVSSKSNATCWKPFSSGLLSCLFNALLTVHQYAILNNRNITGKNRFEMSSTQCSSKYHPQVFLGGETCKNVIQTHLYNCIYRFWVPKFLRIGVIEDFSHHNHFVLEWPFVNQYISSSKTIKRLRKIKIFYYQNFKPVPR